MSEDVKPRVAIVDYGMGNLFSVKHAFEQVGMPAFVTSSREDVLNADAVVLPGVGAFGDAMRALDELDLVGPLRDVAASEKVLVGICLGMQLLMTESLEFGTHRGLGVFDGPVVRLNPLSDAGHSLKVPHVGWSRIYASDELHRDGAGWEASPLSGVADGEYMYFVHSYYPVPEDPGVATSYSRYGDVEFCSSIWRGNVFACQFHPERSGPQGLNIYRNLVSMISRKGASNLGHS